MASVNIGINEILYCVFTVICGIKERFVLYKMNRKTENADLHKTAEKPSVTERLKAAGISKYQLLPMFLMLAAGFAIALIISDIPVDVRVSIAETSLSSQITDTTGISEDLYSVMTDDTRELELMKGIASEFNIINEIMNNSAKPEKKPEPVTAEQPTQPTVIPEIPFALTNPVALTPEEAQARAEQIKANEEAARQRTNAVWCKRVSAGNRNLYLPQYYYGAPAMPKNSYGSYPVNTQGIPMSDMQMPASLTFDQYGVPTNYLYCLEGKATAYYGGPGTATGQNVHQGCVAVDPRIIPYGTEMWIVSSDGRYIYGYSRAEDTGGFIYYSKGPLVDLYMDTYASCCAWGLRNVKIYILPSTY